MNTGRLDNFHLILNERHDDIHYIHAARASFLAGETGYAHPQFVGIQNFRETQLGLSDDLPGAESGLPAGRAGARAGTALEAEIDGLSSALDYLLCELGVYMPGTHGLSPGGINRSLYLCFEFFEVYVS